MPGEVVDGLLGDDVVLADGWCKEHAELSPIRIAPMKPARQRHPRTPPSRRVRRNTFTMN